MHAGGCHTSFVVDFWRQLAHAKDFCAARGEPPLLKKHVLHVNAVLISVRAFLMHVHAELINVRSVLVHVRAVLINVHAGLYTSVMDCSPCLETFFLGNETHASRSNRWCLMP